MTDHTAPYSIGTPLAVDRTDRVGNVTETPYEIEFTSNIKVNDRIWTFEIPSGSYIYAIRMYTVKGATPATFKIGAKQSDYFGQENGGTDLDDDALFRAPLAAPAAGAAWKSYFNGFYGNTRYDANAAPYMITISPTAGVTEGDKYIMSVTSVKVLDNG